MFCRQRQLAEPVFTISTTPVKPLSDIKRSFKKLQDSDSDDTNNQYTSRGKEDSGWDDNSNMSCEDEDSGSGDMYDQYMSWKDGYSGLDNTNKQHRSWKDKDSGWDDSSDQYRSWKDKDSGSENTNKQYRSMGKEEVPVPGTETGCRCEVKVLSKSHDLVLVFNSELLREGELCYSKCFIESTIIIGKCLKGLTESNKEIEFEVGNGSMNPHLESVVTQMSVGQYACFVTNLPAEGLVLAAATDTVRTRSL